MHVTACLAGQEDVSVEVGEECRTLQALKESIVKELPQLCVEGFDVSVGGRALDDDEQVVSLEEDVSLDVSANTRSLSVLTLREAGREVSVGGLLAAAHSGDLALCTLYLDAGVPAYAALPLACDVGDVALATLLLDRDSTAIDVTDFLNQTPLHTACMRGGVQIATLLLDRGCRANAENTRGNTALHFACSQGNVALATLLLDRGAAVDVANYLGNTPLHFCCSCGRTETAALLLDRGSTAIDAKNSLCETPLHLACSRDQLGMAALLLRRGCRFDAAQYKDGKIPRYKHRVMELLLSQRRFDTRPRSWGSAPGKTRYAASSSFPASALRSSWGCAPDPRGPKAPIVERT